MWCTGAIIWCTEAKYSHGKISIFDNSIRSPGHLQSCTLVTLLSCSYHSLGSRLWASRHRRELSGWISCTIQIKPRKRRKQYRWTYGRATWKEERRHTKERVARWQIYRAIHTLLMTDVLPRLFLPWVVQSCKEHYSNLIMAHLAATGRSRDGSRKSTRTAFRCNTHQPLSRHRLHLFNMRQILRCRAGIGPLNSEHSFFKSN